MVLPTVEECVSVTLLLVLGTLFPLLGHLVQPGHEGFYLVLLYLVLLCLVVVSWRPALSCRRNLSGAGLRERRQERELGGVEGEETVLGIVLYARRMYFQKKLISK